MNEDDIKIYFGLFFDRDLTPFKYFFLVRSHNFFPIFYLDFFCRFYFLFLFGILFYFILFPFSFSSIFFQFQFNFSSISVQVLLNSFSLFFQSFYLYSFLSNCVLILDFFQIFLT
jgi:hypothetical protein